MGLVEERQARQFLFPRLRDLRDPLEIGGMQKAVDRIFQSIDQRETVVLYGDYDVDGVTSVALLNRMLKAFGADVRTFLPHRLEEGYGLSEDGVQRCLALHSPKLLIALDCGTTAADRISEIEAGGVDVVVVDHHESKGRLPVCRAFVNPKIGSSYHYLCTAGLVFKLCHALLRARRLSDFDLKKCLDLVALATIADLVPLVDENRTFVHHGLRQLEQTEWIGLRALMEVAGVTAAHPACTCQLSPRAAPECRRTRWRGSRCARAVAGGRRREGISSGAQPGLAESRSAIGRTEDPR